MPNQMKHIRDTTGVPTEEVPGGTLYFLDERRILARAEHGGSCTVVLQGHPNSLRRNAENYLRRKEGLTVLPRICATCGADVVDHAPPYCSRECHMQRNRRRRFPEIDFEALSADELRARLDVIWAERPAHLRGEGDAQNLLKWEQPMIPQANGHMFLSGVEQADAIIRARGGIVPQRQDFWQYLHEYEAAKVPDTQAS